MTYDATEKCEYPMCPGYEEDPEQPMLKRDDGEWHEECLSAYTDEQARFFAGQMREHREPTRAIEAVDEFLDDLLERADVLRKGEP
jgi:hypothetical protein